MDKKTLFLTAAFHFWDPFFQPCYLIRHFSILHFPLSQLCDDHIGWLIGCPFRHSDVDILRQKLQSMNMTGDTVAEVFSLTLTLFASASVHYTSVMLCSLHVWSHCRVEHQEWHAACKRPTLTDFQFIGDFWQLNLICGSHINWTS